MPFFTKLCFSKTLQDKNASHKIAFIAVFTAFSVIANMFFEVKFADIQFSFTICVSAIIGIILGPVFGFVASFTGDLVGFLVNSGGYAYMPWIGLAMGMVSFIAGAIFAFVKSDKPWFIFVKLLIIAVTTFLLCTVAINTTAFWILYGKVPYFKYLLTRLFIQGQIYNSLVNYVLLFIAVPILSKIKQLNLNI